VSDPSTERSCRRFQLVRREDETGISGTGVVAYGAAFPDGTAVLRWDTKVNSTVFYSSIDDLQAIHGHDGKTTVMWLDVYPDADYGQVWQKLIGYVQQAAADRTQISPAGLLDYLGELRREALTPVREWMDETMRGKRL
jgi:hypothetical protein